MTGDGASTTSQREQDDFEGAAVRRRMSTRIGAIVGAVALAGGLAACSGGTPGAAAVIDGHTIDIAMVDEATAQIGDVVGSNPQANLTVLFVQDAVLHPIAQENGFAVSDEEASEALDAMFEEAGTDRPDEPYAQGTLVWARFQMEANKLSLQADAVDLNDEFNETFAAADLAVNPRWISKTDDGQMSLTTYPWIVGSGQSDPTTATAE